MEIYVTLLKIVFYLAIDMDCDLWYDDSINDCLEFIFDNRVSDAKLDKC
jgi:hypothetical protein